MLILAISFLIISIFVCFLLKELSKLIPKSEVGVLSKDSNNVVNLIVEAYNVRNVSFYKPSHRNSDISLQ